MSSSDPMKFVNFPGPFEEIDSFSDLDYHNIKKASIILRALNNKLRQQVIKTIHDNRRLTVTELYKQLHLEQSLASQQLAILRKAGIVSTERKGKFIFYTISPSRLGDINKYIRNLMV